MGCQNEDRVCRTQWKLVLLLVGAGVVAAFQVGKVPPVLSQIRDELQITLFLAGWVLSIFNLIGFFLGSMAGAAADVFGRRRILITGILLQGLGSLMGSFARGAGVLLASRVLEGLGLLAVVTAAPAMIVEVTRPRDLRLILSIWSCFLPLGASLIMVITPFVMPFSGWRGLWQFNAAILAVFAFFLVRGNIEDRSLGKEAGGKRIWRDLRVTMTSPGPVLLAVIFATYALQWLCVMGFLPTLLLEQFRLAPGRASRLTALMVAMNVPGNLIGGWLLHRGFQRWKLIMTASIIMGACSLIIYAPHYPFVASYLACLLFSGAGGLLPASVLGGAPFYSPGPGQLATTNGLIMQGGQFGQFIGPPILALIVSAGGGWKSAPWLLVGTAVLGVMLSFGLPLLERRRPAAEKSQEVRPHPSI